MKMVDQECMDAREYFENASLASAIAYGEMFASVSIDEEAALVAEALAEDGFAPSASDCGDVAMLSCLVFEIQGAVRYAQKIGLPIHETFAAFADADIWNAPPEAWFKFLHAQILAARAAGHKKAKPGKTKKARKK